MSEENLLNEENKLHTKRYWVILGANGLREASEIHEGDVITIPARDSINGANGILLR